MRRAVLAFLVGVAVMAVPSQAAAGTPVAGHLRVAIETAAANADFSKTASRQSVVILHEWEAAKMRKLKAADPGITVLVYKNLSGMMAAAPYDVASTGVTTEQAASHPDWYLKNTGGERFTFGSYGWIYAADIGNAGYQKAWGDNVLGVLGQGWDGVFADDTNPTIKWHYDVAKVAKYPSDASYGAATGAMLKAVGPRIRAAGKLIVPNFASWSGYREVVDSWLPSVSGGMEEQFVKWGTDPDVGYVTGADWEKMLGAIKLTEASGKLFLGIAHSQNTDAGAARYGWATVLLAGNGRSSFALHGDYANETWFADYDLNLGAAAGAEFREASGVHRRAFANGLVLVNPTTTSVSVDFGGTYSGSGLAKAAGAVMPPHSGLILERADGTTPAPAPTPTPTPSATPSPTPAPAPAATPAPATTPVVPKKRRKTSAVRIRVSCVSARTSCRQKLVLQARHRKAKLRVGHCGVKVSARGSAVVRVPLTAEARKLLRRGKSLAVVVRNLPLGRSGKVQVVPSVLRVR